MLFHTLSQLFLRNRNHDLPIETQEGIQQQPNFPDAIACQFSTSQKLVVVYRDHNIYIWNIHGKENTK
ncbi:hypothetical protein L2E82_40149 [Cichorium intybus]|uniref:Uncharacterized protein n=1 Tax=Cichorium intybus TaxID=13427 RepID=A0ACB9AL52_CICIN|nr:hypothetical protein L2E82_40149 [Cichorium intybus]